MLTRKGDSVLKLEIVRNLYGRVLPLPLTIAILNTQRLLRAWSPSGGRQLERCFYFTQSWRHVRERLAGPQNHLVKWWDEDGHNDDEDQEAMNPKSLVDPSLDPSARGRLDTLVEQFVCGFPRNRLARPMGAGMEPPFKRMEKRRGIDLSPVVEMRTAETRTFGFFVRKDVFVAHRLDLADNTHAERSLYGKYGADVLTLLARMEPSEKDTTSDIENLIGDKPNGRH